jgi:predicted nucleic-acid-binding Zn-ribbon protein
MPERSEDWRSRRIWDLEHNEKIVIACSCGRSVHYSAGHIQRLHRIPSDTLIYDLRYRFRCSRCNSRDGVEVSIRLDTWPPDRI